MDCWLIALKVLRLRAQVHSCGGRDGIFAAATVVVLV